MRIGRQDSAEVDVDRSRWSHRHAGGSVGERFRPIAEQVIEHTFDDRAMVGGVGAVGWGEAIRGPAALSDVVGVAARGDFSDDAPPD